VIAVNLDRRIAEMLSVRRVSSGVVVASTAASALDSKEGGLVPGDVIYAVNRAPVAGLADLRAVLDGLRADDAVVLQVERGGELLFLSFTVE
jgi:S1-C subfamily serine protease